MLVLFIVSFCVYKVKIKEVAQNNETIEALTDSLQRQDSLLALKDVVIGALRRENDSVNATNQQLQQIFNLNEQFKVLSENSALSYVPEKKMFVAKDFIGIEIFEPNDDKIKSEYVNKVKEVGRSLEYLVKELYEKSPKQSFQLVIEGYAAIEWEKKLNHSYKPDDRDVYILSYKRALAVYNKWRDENINLRKYNTEIIIAGSGLNGINRDNKNENNNKRFVIQIIPKIAKPK